MVFVISKKTTKKEFDKLNSKIQSKKKGVDTFKYCGKVRFAEDALTLQKQWRDEWQ
jgi:hypothetical protein